jgi:hypothetical protein
VLVCLSFLSRCLCVRACLDGEAVLERRVVAEQPVQLLEVPLHFLVQVGAAAAAQARWARLNHLRHGAGR